MSGAWHVSVCLQRLGKTDRSAGLTPGTCSDGTPPKRRVVELEVLHPAARARALEVLALAAAAAPLGEPNPLQVEHLGDEERHDPGQELGAGEDVHHRNVPAR